MEDPHGVGFDAHALEEGDDEEMTVPVRVVPSHRSHGVSVRMRGLLGVIALTASAVLLQHDGTATNAKTNDTDPLLYLRKVKHRLKSMEERFHILQSLGGTPAPAGWQGSLNLPHGYMIGDDEATVLNLDMEMDNSISPIWDIIGTIRGDVEPQEEVQIGNHRDAWVCGVIDPSSGSATMLEVARGFGELLNRCWKPRRTIKMGSWDGEEYGLLGSTEYAEDDANHLSKHAVAYINVDHLIGPFATAAGTPSIAWTRPRPSRQTIASASTLYDQWTAQAELRRVQTYGRSDDQTLGPEHLICFLGSGTAYTPFYQHLGIVSAHLQLNLCVACTG